jgi:carbon storage regulator CsrA
MMVRITEEHRPLEIRQWVTMPVDGPGKTEEEVVQEEARMRLRESPYRELWEVACEFQQGELTLKGRVPSFFLKQVAQSIVFVMEHVDKINNRLEVVAAMKV